MSEEVALRLDKLGLKGKAFFKMQELMRNLGNKYVTNYYTRPMTTFAKEHFGDKSLVAVEIGSFKGFNAKNICENLNIKRLYCIDPYTVYVDQIERDRTDYYEKAQKFLSKYPVTFVRKYSSDAVDDVPDNIDYCYIDGNHEYEFCKKDIELYYPKMTKGGIIGGHDFNGSFIGVVKSVLEFAEKEGLELHTNLTDWWVIV